ncbi:ATP-binding protein [Clostridium sp. C1]|uniref:ATP-binding protein n=1 Tax=Clostridium sp. C1 TaxID=1155388 RepID=UPI001BA89C9E|nr:AAA family ATPase [Clostridium sp. C1]QUN11760.1 ATP-binding protein [Clostridium sp. C1]
MKRIIYNDLIEWKNKKVKKPLIIKGARQVGKTYIIREFAKNNYKNLVEINFERDHEFQELFKQTKTAHDLLQYFELTYMDIQFDNDTLLFLDEIQACGDAFTALKFLSEDFPCDIICSGSMLGVAVASSSSFPVGYVETWDMYPLTFLEFVDAMGVNPSIIDTIYQSIENNKPIPISIHEKFNQFFKDYMIIGGMPEVVQTYFQTKSYREALLIQRQIVDDYRNDMLKYAHGSERIKARECYDSIPLQLAKENKKFQYKLIKKGGNARYYESSLDWLKDSGLIIKTYRLKTPEIPLEINKELNIFKVYMADTGLLVSQFDEAVIKAFISGNLEHFKGALYENVIAQILHSKKKDSYYFEPSQSQEIDFVIYYQGNVTPIEVKSSRNTVSTSFHNFIKTYKPSFAFKFSQKNIGENSQNVCYYPLYTLEFVLNKEKPVLLK